MGKVPWSDGEVAELPLQGALLIARKRELFNHAANVVAAPALRSSWRERWREAWAGDEQGGAAKVGAGDTEATVGSEGPGRNKPGRTSNLEGN